MSITPLPEAPSPLDPPDVFNAKAYAFFTALGVFGEEASQLAAAIDFDSTDIQNATAVAAVAGGTSDAITATFTPTIAVLTNGMTLYVRASFANSTASPTFSPGAGIEPSVIVKDGGLALEPGAISGPGHWLRLTWDAALARWELANPRTVFASAAENAAGTAEGKPVDPLGIREAFNATGNAPVFACRAWVNFNGTGTVAIRASGNVSSITDNGTGSYTVNLTTEMPDDNFAAVPSTDGGDRTVTSGISSTSAVLIRTSQASVPTPSDQSQVTLAIFR